MYTRLDCLPCFLRQALNGARLTAPQNPEKQRQILATVSEEISRMDTRLSPPHLAGGMYSRITEISGTKDPFSAYKEKSNAAVLDLLPQVISQLENEKDRIFFALRLSIIGNYMDAGAGREFDWQTALYAEKDSRWAELHYPRFRDELSRPGKVLIIGDNAGEIALDTILVKELNRLGHQVHYAVRGTPILNDATMEDARQVGLTEICNVFSSGSDCPGAVTSRCSKDFLQRMDEADVVISKGQGNFEALSEEKSGIYFAFKVKCEVVSNIVDLPIGTSVFRLI